MLGNFTILPLAFNQFLGISLIKKINNVGVKVRKKINKHKFTYKSFKIKFGGNSLSFFFFFFLTA